MKMVKVARIGDKIEWLNKRYEITLSGIVTKINQNSVIVILNNAELYTGLEIPEITVVNHRNYTIKPKAAIGR